MLNFRKTLKCKKGIGIAEVLIAALVLGLMCMALYKLQVGNHDSFLRIRGRDGAVEVAQRVLDSLKTVGVASIPTGNDATKPYVYTIGTVDCSWERGLGGSATVRYTPTITVSPVTSENVSTNTSSYESVQHVFAKQVKVTVAWQFKGSTQSIDVSGVVR